MNVLITGGSGFVGQNLLAFLSKFTAPIELTRMQLNNLRPQYFNQTQTVIHLAGKAHDLKQVSSPSEYYDINFGLTKKLFDQFLQSNAKKFIFISSVKAAADIVPEILYEDVQPTPETHYGKSKLMAEQYIQSQVLPEGKSYYILRPCMIHGPGNRGNLNMLFKVVKSGIPFPLASFENRRSFLSVENLCFLIHEVLKSSDLPPGIYNVADDEALSTNEVVRVLAESLGKSPKLWHIPKNLIKAAAKIGDLIHLPLNTETVQKLTDNYIVSNTKIKSGLNIELPLNARSGLLLTAKSFQSI
jgi:nucleoside-diphosphate-sugar epimerase